VDRPVIVYSTPLCAPCEQLKRYLMTHDVSFVMKDLMMDEDAAEFIEGQGIRTSPVLQVGEVLLHGNDLQPGNIDGLLGLDHSNPQPDQR
jgi:glutaredoxin-like protein NrdH